jgi:hypothetical protein
MPTPQKIASKFKPPITEIPLPDGETMLPIGWGLVTSYNNKGMVTEIWTPILRPQDITPANVQLVREHVLAFYPDAGDGQSQFEVADPYTLYSARVTENELNDTIVKGGLLANAAENGIRPGDFLRHSSLKSALQQAVDNISAGNIMGADWGSKMAALSRNVPPDSALGDTLSNDPRVKQFNEQTVRDVMGLPVEKIGDYFGQRNQQLASLLIQKDTGIARSYISAMPQDQQAPLMDALNLQQHPELERSQGIDLTGGLNQSIQAQQEEAQRLWEMQAQEAARAGNTEMPGIQKVSLQVPEGTGAVNSKVAAARLTAAVAQDNANLALSYSDQKRRSRWQQLVEQARNRNVNSQIVTRV